MPRLTDKERKQIIAEYVDCQSYNEVAKKHKISATTVKKWVLKDTESVKKCEQKKQKAFPSSDLFPLHFSVSFLSVEDCSCFASASSSKRYLS